MPDNDKKMKALRALLGVREEQNQVQIFPPLDFEGPVQYIDIQVPEGEIRIRPVDENGNWQDDFSKVDAFSVSDAPQAFASLSSMEMLRFDEDGAYIYDLTDNGERAAIAHYFNYETEKTSMVEVQADGGLKPVEPEAEKVVEKSPEELAAEAEKAAKMYNKDNVEIGRQFEDPTNKNQVVKMFYMGVHPFTGDVVDQTSYIDSKESPFFEGYQFTYEKGNEDGKPLFVEYQSEHGYLKTDGGRAEEGIETFSVVEAKGVCADVMGDPALFYVQNPEQGLFSDRPGETRMIMPDYYKVGDALSLAYYPESGVGTYSDVFQEFKNEDKKKKAEMRAGKARSKQFQEIAKGQFEEFTPEITNALPEGAVTFGESVEKPAEDKDASQAESKGLKASKEVDGVPQDTSGLLIGKDAAGTEYVVGREYEDKDSGSTVREVFDGVMPFAAPGKDNYVVKDPDVLKEAQQDPSFKGWKLSYDNAADTKPLSAVYQDPKKGSVTMVGMNSYYEQVGASKSVEMLNAVETKGGFDGVYDIVGNEPLATFFGEQGVVLTDATFSGTKLANKFSFETGKVTEGKATASNDAKDVDPAKLDKLKAKAAEKGAEIEANASGYKPEIKNEIKDMMAERLEKEAPAKEEVQQQEQEAVEKTEAVANKDVEQEGATGFSAPESKTEEPVSDTTTQNVEEEIAKAEAVQQDIGSAYKTTADEVAAAAQEALSKNNISSSGVENAVNSAEVKAESKPAVKPEVSVEKNAEPVRADSIAQTLVDTAKASAPAPANFVELPKDQQPAATADNNASSGGVGNSAPAAVDSVNKSTDLSSRVAAAAAKSNNVAATPKSSGGKTDLGSDGLDAALNAFGSDLDRSGHKWKLNGDYSLKDTKIEELKNQFNANRNALTRYYSSDAAKADYKALQDGTMKYADFAKKHPEADKLERKLVKIMKDGKPGDRGFLQNWINDKAGQNLDALNQQQAKFWNDRGTSVLKDDGTKRGGLPSAQIDFLKGKDGNQ